MSAIDDAEYDLARLEENLHSRFRNGAVQYLMVANPHLGRALRSRYRRWKRSWNLADGLIAGPGDHEVLTLLSAYRLADRTYSPSTLERFARCPYEFALHAIQGLRPPPRTGACEALDPPTRGSLFHAVQRRLFERLRDADLLPVRWEHQARVEDMAHAVLEETAAAFAEELAPAIPYVWKTAIDELRKDLDGWIQEVAKTRGEWTPVAAELEFEQKVLGARLHGSIDLVERRGRSGELRISDFKTGKPPDVLPAITGNGQVLQPLLYGLAVEAQSEEPVASGRLYYATRRGGYVAREIDLSSHARSHIETVLRTIDGAIADGFLPAAPVKEACRNCDYRLVCGPYEETRAGRKDKSRLSGLEHIRSVP
jgi:RecB family exonuclease